MASTKKGLTLAFKLHPALPKISPYSLLRECSAICRTAASLERIATRICEEEMSEKEAEQLDAKDDRLEQLVLKHVQVLNLIGGIQMVPRFHGDPRGPIVTIVMPEPWRNLHNYGQEGIIVP